MTDGLLGRGLRLVVDGQPLVVPLVLTERRTIWWIFTDESGEPAYMGREIEPTGSSLPEVLTLEEHALVLEPVEKWDKETGAYLSETYPFETTRKFDGTVGIEDFSLRVKVRITVKKNKKWNLTVRVWGAEGALREAEPRPEGGLIDLLVAGEESEDEEN
mgnify:CR=1 FL=1|jgi:hypothetical protein